MTPPAQPPVRWWISALALLSVVTIGIIATYGLVAAQARWDAARYTIRDLELAQHATREALQARDAAVHERDIALHLRDQAETSAQAVEADYARYRTSIAELLAAACRR